MKKIIVKKDRDFDGSVVGIFEQKNGEFLAMTYTKSKTFKTLKGAIKFLQSFGFEVKTA